jgi:EmrB/QacA subfamily drug resistance transporter
METRTRASRKQILLLLCCAQFMLVLDFAIVNVALPSIQRSLGFSHGGLQWVVGAYALFFGGFLLIGGRAGDLFGRKRMFIAGLAIFTAASLVGGLATSPIMLIAARAGQGLAAAAVSPAVVAMIVASFTENAVRAKAMGVFGAVASAGFTGGVLAGGILTQYIGWRAVLFLNIPVGIVLVALAARMLANDHGRKGGRIDVPSAVLVTTAMCLVSYALTVSGDKGWGAPTVAGPLVAGGVLLIAFIVLQARLRSPLVPLSIFRNRSLTAGDSIAFLSGGVMSISTFFLTLYMQQALHYSVIKTGLAFFPQAFIVILVSKHVAQYTGKLGARTMLVFGAILLTAGSLLLTQVSAGGSFLFGILPGGLLLGIGVATMMISTAFAATSGVPGPQLGLASGLYNSSRQLGVGLCLAIAVSVANIGPAARTISGYHTAFALSAGLSAAIAVIAWVGLPAVKKPVAGPVLVAAVAK